ncbi:hypothetical protein ACFYUV_09720 [Nonomuraea sp. NPDC003560]|uniref:hypothetical protein n=1 Tax=Nonomuraea sp. NPDC003560 TaxID=3364341 RepID=UPI0036859100
MRLTWKDAVATAVMGVITAVHVVFLQQADVLVLGSVRGVASVILVLGAVLLSCLRWFWCAVVVVPPAGLGVAQPVDAGLVVAR